MWSGKDIFMTSLMSKAKQSTGVKEFNLHVVQPSLIPGSTWFFPASVPCP